MVRSLSLQSPLPRRLLYTHQLPFIRQPTETDSRHPKQLRHGPRPASEHAPVPYPRKRTVPRQLRQLVTILLSHFARKLRILAKRFVELPSQLESRREQSTSVICAVSLHSLLRTAVFRRLFRESCRDLSGLDRRFDRGSP